ncbi:flagellar biosynthetic protein FliR [Burkholderia ubonensis]|uniref:Flagellar biosynthetic protein FliR n=1 Tax=Burkholderia ubonensis TaxID=101571 RepID=A0A119NNW5_9BURK|nr:flagellar biosynthetic protein FliR [Burkholderia ubonensis]AOJ75563.1 flagellar biosynthetic protein FliR [Burkholderia ubonensis]KWE51631.1 flagellar biosynthetic protein FliR [Burkholderia ubonensis]KWE65480.1 flagellar biosynthetic protein FliR [Burkholderia ubonensis]KWE65766.1 flagellar biosynthetic protein FliR [Burkholderia ubonensis]KWK87039.1 flagellar biosynthetic protein FliR [Burkholderia ubonensis]
MFSVTYAQLNAWLTAFLWPFVRMLALVAVAPVTGHASVPGRVKIGVAAFMALVVAPTLGAMPAVTVFSAQGIWIVVTQFLIGVAMGFTMQIVFAAAQAAGDAIGLSMGLGFATFFDPHASGATPVMGRFLNAVAILAFLAFDGHLQVLAALAASFQALPVSAELLHAPGWRTLAAFGATVFQMGLLLALPVVAALLIANLALGILNRAAPQVGIFQVGFPVTMLVGLLLVQLMVPNMVPFFGRLFDMGLDAMGRVLGGWR